MSPSIGDTLPVDRERIGACSKEHLLLVGRPPTLKHMLAQLVQPPLVSWHAPATKVFISIRRLAHSGRLGRRRIFPQCSALKGTGGGARRERSPTSSGYYQITARTKTHILGSKAVALLPCQEESD